MRPAQGKFFLPPSAKQETFQNTRIRVYSRCARLTGEPLPFAKGRARIF